MEQQRAYLVFQGYGDGLKLELGLERLSNRGEESRVPEEKERK